GRASLPETPHPGRRKKLRRQVMNPPPQLFPVQRGPKPEGLELASKADGDLEVGAVEGAVVALVLSIAGVEDVVVPLPAIAGADLEALDLVGETERQVENRNA